MEKGRVHLIISGFVQGVFYRANTCDTAMRLGLKGWVRNLPDGSVEAVFEGPVEKLKQAVAWCHQGPPGARVTKIDEKRDDYTGEFDGFDVRYGW
ncbi:MAG TPA: acylphosphatase [Nitrospirae bacterium]|nr:acylphosphatase [Nitrospirota bacterium]